MIIIYVSYLENVNTSRGQPTPKIIEIVADEALEDALKKDYAQIIGFGEAAGNGGK